MRVNSAAFSLLLAAMGGLSVAPAGERSAWAGASAKPAPAGASTRTAPSVAVKGANDGARRAIAGAPTEADASRGAESAELAALRKADLELFPPASPSPTSVWPSDWPFPAYIDPARPRVHASGLPPPVSAPLLPKTDGDHDVSWLGGLALPELPIRWDGRVIRYLEYYRDDPRGRAVIGSMLKRSGRYATAMRKILRAQFVPDDLLWVALVESGFEPTIRSAAGAGGFWQLMPGAAKAYGLTVDRWIDERFDLDRATEAAGRYLADLHRRFGSWELALAAYNMGYGALLASIRKYNTNDFWELSRLEAGLPWETTIYVPKIIAVAVIAKNFSAFGVDALGLEPPLQCDTVSVPSGTTLRAVAQAAGVDVREIEALNPQIRAGRTPPAEPGVLSTTWRLRVPTGKGSQVSNKLALVEEPATGARYLSRIGDTLDRIASEHGISRAALADLNGVRADEAVRPGTVLLLPPNDAPSRGPAAALAPAALEPPVVLPTGDERVPGRTRVFYRVVVGDTIGEIASALRVEVGDLLRWNRLDPTARLHDGMVLQAFCPKEADLARVVHQTETEARVLKVGTDGFFSYFEGLRDRRRLVITARDGDTFEKVAKRYDLTQGQLERINHRSRTDKLASGEQLVVYAPVERRAAKTRVEAEPAPLVPGVARSDDDVPGLIEPAHAPVTRPPAELPDGGRGFLASPAAPSRAPY